MATPPWKAKAAGATGGALPTGQFVLTPPTPRGEIIAICGASATGKTLLSCLIERTRGPVGFIDLEDSLPVLADRLNELSLSPQRVGGVDSWRTLIECMESNVFDGMKNIVIDTGTEAQVLAMSHTCATVATDGGSYPKSIEGYGFGKGGRYLHDTWLDLKTACKAQSAQGRNVILVLHDMIAKVPNPDGADFIRWEPNLYQDNSVSLRNTTMNFVDHMFYIGYDISATAPEAKKGQKHGKAVGGGSRQIYCSETATCKAKSRRLSGSIPYEYGDDALWRALFNVETPKEN